MAKTTNLNLRIEPNEKEYLIRVSGGDISRALREALRLYFASKKVAGCDFYGSGTMKIENKEALAAKVTSG